MTEELKPCPFCGGKEVKLFKEGGYLGRGVSAMLGESRSDGGR